MKFLLLAIMLMPQFSSAQSSSAKEKFCQQRQDLQKFISQPSNQISFYNQGGLFGGGVCWWHSRFTRAAAYLAMFDPEAPRPSEEEAKKIISHLRHRKGVVTIPGFRNLYEFTSVYSREVLNKLSDWQKSDGVLKAAWIKGIKGSTKIKATEMQERMDDLYAKIKDGNIVYQKLQIPGIDSHAWLVVGMDETPSGYQIKVVDSNNRYGGTETYEYEIGMESLEYGYGDGAISLVPYIEEMPEERKMQEMNDKACLPN